MRDPAAQAVINLPSEGCPPPDVSGRTVDFGKRRDGGQFFSRIRVRIHHHETRQPRIKREICRRSLCETVFPYMFYAGE